MSWWTWLALGVGYLVTAMVTYVGEVAFWYPWRTRWHRAARCERDCACRRHVAEEDRDVRSRAVARHDAEVIAAWLAPLWPLSLAFHLGWGTAVGTCRLTWRGLLRPLRSLARRGVEHDLARARFDAEARAEEADATARAELATLAERRAAEDAIERGALARHERLVVADVIVPTAPAAYEAAVRRLVANMVDQLGPMTATSRAAFLAALAEAALVEAARRGVTG